MKTARLGDREKRRLSKGPGRIAVSGVKRHRELGYAAYFGDYAGQAKRAALVARFTSDSWTRERALADARHCGEMARDYYRLMLGKKLVRKEEAA